MGSAILADPAMRKAQRIFDSELFFVIFRRNASSLDLLHTVADGNIYMIRDNNLLTLAIDTFGFLRWTRRRKIDSVIDLELFSRFTAILVGLSGAAHRVGFHRFHSEGLYRGEMFTRRVTYNPHIHIAKNFIALVNALASARPETPYSKTFIDDTEITLPQVSVTSAAIAKMRRRIATIFPGYDSAHNRIVLINPYAGELLPQRRWPQRHFATLAAKVLERWDDVLVVITGSPEEREEAQGLAMLFGHPRVINFAGLQRLEELPALYGIATLMVTADSGPAHFASVSTLPTLVLFGPETPILYKPLGNARAITAGLACSPCVSAANHRKTACTDPVCMSAVLPDRVFQAIADILEGNTNASEIRH